MVSLKTFLIFVSFFHSAVAGDCFCRLSKRNATIQDIRSYINPDFLVTFFDIEKHVNLKTENKGYFVDEFESDVQLYYSVKTYAPFQQQIVVEFQVKSTARVDHTTFVAKCMELNGTKTLKTYHLTATGATAVPHGDEWKIVKVHYAVRQQQQSDCYLKHANRHPYTFERFSIYLAHGEQSAANCDFVALCDNGNYGGYFPCAPSFLENDDRYIELRGRGLCCTIPLGKASVEKNACKKSHGDLEQILNFDAPWMVRFTQPNWLNATCDGVLLSKNFFVAPTSCLSGGEVILVQYPGDAFSISVAETSTLGGGNGKLALAKLSAPLVEDWSKHVQAINLPWASLCQKMMTPTCPTVIGSVRKLEPGARYVPSFTDAVSTVESTVELSEKCPGMEDASEFCVRKTQNALVQQGSFVSGAIDDFNFLVGLYAGNKPGNATANLPDMEKYGIVYSICPYLSEIQLKIKGDE